MRLLLLLTFATFGHSALLGSKKCTYGPSYWCSHIQHAKECNTMEHCMNKVWNTRGLADSTDKCHEVTEVIENVRRSSNVLEQMAKSCAMLPAEKHSVCKEFMHYNQQEVLLLLHSELSSRNIAAALGLCGDVSDTDSNTASQTVAQPQATKNQVAKAGDYCSDCVNFFADIQVIVTGKEEKFAELLKSKICTKMSVFENLCNGTVDLYAAFIMNFTMQQLNPKDLCFLLQMCSADTLAELEKHPLPTTAKTGDENCATCKEIAKYAQDFVKDPAIQNDILSMLKDDLCALLPTELASECQKYVSDYGPLAMQLLIAELDPPSICQTLGFCNGTGTEKKLSVVALVNKLSSVRVLAPLPESQAQFSPECFICTEVLSKLEHMIDINATEKDIDSAMKEVCSFLPSMRAECDDFVDKYGDRVVKLILEEGPEVVCTALGLCLGDRHVKLDRVLPVKMGEACLMCQTIGGYISLFINDPANEKTIEQILDEVCHVLPSTYQPLCVQLINAYTPELLEYLRKNDDPRKLCTDLHLCNNSMQVNNDKTERLSHPLLFQPLTKLQPAMSTKPCTQGPTVMCANVHTARRCKAVQFCVKYHNMKLDD